MKAIVFVDVQNDFIAGALKNPAAEAVVPKIVEFAKDVIAKSRPDCKLYATMDTHSEDYAKTLEGSLIPSHCIEGTEGWEIDSRLSDVIHGFVTYVQKKTFGSNDLVELIKEDEMVSGQKFDEIVLCGFCTSICVAANAILLRAAFPDKKIVVKKDLCACISEDSHNAALTTLRMQQINVE